MKTSFTIETGQPDANGDVINLEGLQVHNPVLVTRDFNRLHPIGQCTVRQEDGVLKAEMNLPDEVDGFPAIGFSVQQAEANAHGGRNILHATLHEVSISASPNIDSRIKRISEQA